MRDYSPKRRTALVLAGSGTSGAYHAGVLKALDESGVKIDLLVGSGAGTVAAAFGAVAGGSHLYGRDGFWEGVRWASFYRLRPLLRAAALILGSAFCVFLLPMLLAIVMGVLFPVAMLVDALLPGLLSRLLEAVSAAPEALRVPYLAALAAPSLVLSAVLFVALVRLLWRDPRRLGESLENPIDVEPAQARLRRFLGEVSRGASVPGAPPSEAELGRRYVALASENLGQPGFRELILRAADLETGDALPFVLLADAQRSAFAEARSRGPRSRVEGIPGAVDLRAPGYEALLFDAVMTGLLPPLAAPVRRVRFPRRGVHGGEVHRLCDATLTGGCGIAEALAAGAEQVIVATAVPEAPHPPPRRRGPWALLDGQVAALERRAVEQDLHLAERLNRIVQTLGQPRGEEGEPSWEDPATGRRYRAFGLYVVRPERRCLGPLELDGARDPATEVVESPEDLQERGCRDAYRAFIEPVVGAAPEPPAPRDEAAGRLVDL